MKHILILVIAVLAACAEQESSGPPQATPGKPVVIASNYPLYFFAQQIAGDAVDVRFPEIEGDPAYWAPSGDQAAALQAADLIILNGAGYESWLNFVTLPADRLLDTTADLADQLILMDATVHQHGPEGEHSHPGTAFTTWLNPRLAMEQARAIVHGLSGLLPDRAAEFETNLSDLESQLQELDANLEQAFADLGDEPVVFSHPVYQYLQRRYGINGRSVHWEPDEAPGVRAWIDFNKLLLGHPAKLMIWEGEPLAETKERLAELGAQSVAFGPSGNRPAQGNYFSVMNENLHRLNNTVSKRVE